VVKVADETWLGTALLHHEHPEREDFAVQEIVDRIGQERIHPTFRPGVIIHVTQHAVANKRPNPATYRMLFETGRGRRRLFRHSDLAHPYRQGKILPERQDIPVQYAYLLDWYHNKYDHYALP